MKLPLFQPANTALPSRSSGAAATVDPTGAGLAKIGGDLMQAGRQFGVIAGQQARDEAAEDARAERLRAAAEKAKQDALDDMDASTALETARSDMDVLVGDMKKEQVDPATGEVTPPVGPREFVSEYERRAQVVRENLMRAATTPGAKARIQKAAPQFFGNRLHDARVYSDKLADDEYNSGFELNVSALEQRIGRERDPAERARLETELAGIFQRAQRVIPLTKLQTRGRQSEETIDTALALMEAETDPLGVIEKLRPPLEKGGSKEPSPYRLSTEKAAALAEKIGGRYDRQVTQQETARKASQALIDKEQTEAYHAETSDLYASAKSKLATTEQVEEWRRKYRGRAGLDEDYLRLTKILEEPKKPVKEWKSDPKVEARVMAQVELINPTITRDELIRLNESELLDNNDLKYALGRLRQAQEHQRTLGVTAQGQGQEQARRDHAQAEQELRVRIMGPDSIFKQFDEKKERIFGQYLKQLRVRSSAYGGKEAPLEALDAMTPSALAAVGSQTLMNAAEARAGLTFPNETALVAARKAGKITEPYYREQSARFRVIEQAEAELQQNAAGGNPEAAKALERLRGGKAAPAPSAPSGASVPYLPTLTPRRVD